MSTQTDAHQMSDNYPRPRRNVNPPPFTLRQWLVILGAPAAVALVAWYIGS